MAAGIPVVLPACGLAGEMPDHRAYVAKTKCRDRIEVFLTP
jgi:hypothetical protein